MGAAVKAMLTWKFAALNTCVRRKGRSKSKFSSQENRKKQIKSKVSRRREIKRIKPEINETETRKSIKKINETKSGFLQSHQNQEGTLPLPKPGARQKGGNLS